MFENINEEEYPEYFYYNEAVRLVISESDFVDSLTMLGKIVESARKSSIEKDDTILFKTMEEITGLDFDYVQLRKDIDKLSREIL